VYDANPCEDITAAMKPSLVMQAGVVVAGG
jgi:hypothetical protein